MNETKTLLEALSAAVYTTDAEGRITFYNSAAARMWGREPELGSLWCGSWKIYTPDGEILPHDQCPMAVALKEQRPVRGVEAVVERPDGSRAPFLPFPTPVFDETGNITGAINLLVDLSDIQLVAEDRARLAAIVESSDDAIVSKRLDGAVTSWNRGAEEIFGYAAEEMVGQHITKIIPPDLHAEEVDILARLSRGERIRHYETRRIAKQGESIDVSLTVSPIRDSQGKVIGASKVARDITDRKRAEEIRNLLINELNHRVKNTLATVEAIARQTLRYASDTSNFVTSFSGRIKALAKAHSQLTAEQFERADIAELVRDQLTLGDDADRQISLSGPTVHLEGQTALHLSLVLHELGTNARKYGALAVADGEVSVTWAVESRGTRTLTIDWRETGGPVVTAPESVGFGTTLIEQILTADGGDVTLRYAKSGITCSIRVPLGGDKPAYLPAHEPPAPVKKSFREATQPPASVFSGKRILLVEDEMLIAMVAADYLSDAGCEVVGPASTVENALQLIDSGRIDAALLDGNLRGRSIESVAVALSQQGTPFAFVTGYGRRALPEAFREGLLIEKPFSEAELLSVTKQMLTAHETPGISRLRQPAKP